MRYTAFLPRFLVVFALLCGGWLFGCEATRRVVPGVAGSFAAPASERDFRGIWVTRWDYRTEDDIKRVMSEVASLGLTDVMWQVRGQGDAFYRSRLEPWGEELFRDLPAGWTDPGFDPLAVAVREAHARGLRIHAWANVFPLWKGTKPARDQSHAMHTQPGWWLKDQNGEKQPLNDHYVIVNPAMDEVHDHIARVLRDITTRYSVDGLHLDYVRFVSETHDPGKLYPGDKATLDAYRSAFPKNPDPASPAGRAKYRAWVRGRITTLVERVRAEAVGARRDMELSAAVWRNPEVAKETYLQDAAAWLKKGTIDRAMPMIYTPDSAAYKADLRAWLDEAGGGKVTPGIGIYMHTDTAASTHQIRAERDVAAGYGLFAYSSLFESVDPNQEKSAKARAEREQRRRGCCR